MFFIYFYLFLFIFIYFYSKNLKEQYSLEILWYILLSNGGLIWVLK